MSPRNLRLLQIAAVGLGYLVAGRLGLLLAIPPGYATAVWPPSGIALAGVLLCGWRVWPGIFLGSLLANVWASLDARHGGLLDGLVVPVIVASGAAAQACLGGWLIRRFVGYRNILTQGFDVVWMLLLGGPLACLLNALLGPSVLYLRDAIPPEAYLFNVWTWWVGDSIGVLVFAPLVLLWSVRPYRQWLPRQLLTAVPLLLVFGIAVWLFAFISGREQARLQQRFDAWCEEYAEQLERDIDGYIDALYSIESFYASSEEIDRGEFDSFSTRLMSRLPGAQGLSWAPVIEQAERPAFEEAAHREGLAGYVVRERDADGNLVTVTAARAQYAPVRYISPLDGNERALGFDVYSEPLRRDAAQRARDSGGAAASAVLRLVQERSVGKGMLLFLPVYARGTPHATPAERRANLRGYAVAVLRVDDMLERSLARARLHGLEVRSVDVTDPWQPVAVQESGSSQQRPHDLVRHMSVLVADRRWDVELRLPDAYLEGHRSWQTWTLLAGGMLFTGMFGVFLLMAVGRNAQVVALVEHGTRELQRVNRELVLAASRAAQAEQESRQRAEALTAINKELEQFAYAVSHDLQAPLRNIESFSALLQKKYGAKLEGDGAEFLDLIRGCAGDMRLLIEDLLQLSRVTHERARMDRVDGAEALQAALDLLRTDIASAGAHVDTGPMPTLRADRRLLIQLLQNLIGNAIKFRRADVAPVIQVTAELRGSEWLFRVADNGIGIAAEHVPKLFQVFKRLHTSDQYPGTGIGLALCRKIVQLHGGRIWIESTPGHGTTFLFTLPGLAAEGAPKAREMGLAA